MPTRHDDSAEQGQQQQSGTPQPRQRAQAPAARPQQAAPAPAQRAQPQQRAAASPQRAAAPAAHNAQQSEEDVWDTVMNMKPRGGDGDGGFDKMNTSFYLKDGEEADIVLCQEAPVIFWGHTIKCESEKGTTFYRTEQCQKSVQEYCVFCESPNPSVGKAKKTLAFGLWDSRGSWDKKLNNEAGGLNGIPAPKIFLLPLYLAKTLKTLKDDLGGKISEVVTILSKNSNYVARLKMIKNGASLQYAPAPQLDGEIPDILEVYAPLSDEDALDFIQRFAAGGRSNAAPAGQRGGGATQGRSSGGTFGSFGS